MEKSFFTLEQNVCIVCCATFDTNALLLDKRLRPRFEHKTVTGPGMCPDHQKLHDDGYVALVAIDPEQSVIQPDGNIQQEDAHRTGTVVHLHREAARQILLGFSKENIELPMLFIDQMAANILQEKVANVH